MKSAVVLGFNIHGLAIARALAKNRIPVQAITPSLNMPTVATRFATVHLRPEINSDALIEILLDFSSTVLKDQPAVLFPTSDKMVTALAENWPILQGRYLLSWSHCRNLILTLIRKNNLPELCQKQGVAHPASAQIASKADIGYVFSHIEPPIIVKPARPQSGFKTLIVDSQDALGRIIDEYSPDLPFVAQNYIQGNDDVLYFCTSYFREGVRQFVFTGRKLRAEPPGLGQGTIMEGVHIPELVRLSDRFLQGMNLSGPVAIEFKQDRNGNYWLIEPNVGRTEYCVDLVIQSGINLPLIEYYHATNSDTVPMKHAVRTARIWYDTDKDPRCFLRSLMQTRQFPPFAKRPVFPYLGHNDSRPLGRATMRLARQFLFGNRPS